jgi:hypothetical protein
MPCRAVCNGSAMIYMLVNAPASLATLGLIRQDKTDLGQG